MALFQQITTPTITYEQPLGLFINNEFVKGVEGRTFESINPHNEKPIVAVYEATEKDVDIAVAAARAAFKGPWKHVTPTNRGRMLLKLADLMEQHVDTLAAIEALDNGKAYSIARIDVANAAGCIRYYGGWADKIHGKVIDTDTDSFNYTRHEPIGVCGQIIPWNFPLLMWSWKIGPVVATGNTVVLKSAEQTPLSALYAAKLVVEAGFPPGVINIISGFGRVAGAAISSHMDIDKVAFTGSTLVGRQILQAAAKSNLKKVTLELGGKSPNIVFNDADIDNAISWVNFGIYFNHGQCCCAGSRILVEEGIYDTFLERFKARALQNKVGDPFHQDTFQGPQVSQLQFDRIMGYIREGKAAGAKVEIGGERLGNEGYYIQPNHLQQRHRGHEDRQGRDLRARLAAAVHTTDLNTAIRVSNELKAGTVWVNNYNMLSYQTPFGGFKESGLGRELGEYALDNYTQVKAVRIRLGDALFG
ncbi:aldehyde dehydrogenase [Paracoccidioides brasiliensis Pb18]|uniref:Aldehyde dehydrogenase 1 n=1 Tax=Paracoccidioides brasiliensis (strain Pb18) TaxID=502780 RepID=C1GBT0_PARBD|nr:aldehyde dehydrogenase [Paracoccidioides brasiliensis Pb18]EEH49002.2 aldehyde dehydrogenase [Paracoccidioides brasiliensis Pb18]